MLGPCLSSHVADHPLRPATRHRLGRLLPHQLADRTQTHPSAGGCPHFWLQKSPPVVSSGISTSFPELSPSERQIIYVLLPRSPLAVCNIATINNSFDLHVLGTPPALVLSQDQTLHKNIEIWCKHQTFSIEGQLIYQDSTFINITFTAMSKDLIINNKTRLAS